MKVPLEDEGEIMPEGPQGPVPRTIGGEPLALGAGAPAVIMREVGGAGKAPGSAPAVPLVGGDGGG